MFLSSKELFLRAGISLPHNMAACEYTPSFPLCLIHKFESPPESIVQNDHYEVFGMILDRWEHSLLISLRSLRLPKYIFTEECPSTLVDLRKKDDAV